MKPRGQVVPPSCQLSRAHGAPEPHWWRFLQNGLEKRTDRLWSSKITQLAGRGLGQWGEDSSPSSRRFSPSPDHWALHKPPRCPRASASSRRGAKRGHCALSRGALVGRGEVEGRAGSGGPPEADIRGTYGDLREKTHSSSFFLSL